MAEVDLIIVVLIVIVVICLFATIFGLLYASGLFHHVEIGTGKPPIGQVVIAYKFMKGPYKDCGQLFTEVSSRIKPEQKSLGIYYDDPKVVPSDQLRYIIGGVLAENNEPVDEEQKKSLIEDGFKIFQLPSVSYAVRTDFPYSSYLSIMIAVFRVYPKLSQYVKDKKLCAHPFLEIYDGPKIHFMAPLAKQNEFYVEEAVERNEDGEGDLDESDVASADGSSYGGSVTHSEFSVATSYMESIMEDCVDSEDEDDDLLRLDEVKEEPSDTPIKEINDDTCAEGEVTLSDIQSCVLPELSVHGLEELPIDISKLQDSGFSSEQVVSPEISPLKKDDVQVPETNDGNDSSSSFEVIDDKSTEL